MALDRRQPTQFEDYAFEVFRTMYVILKDTPIVERLGQFEPIPLAKLIDTIGEQFANDLVVGVK